MGLTNAMRAMSQSMGIMIIPFLIIVLEVGETCSRFIVLLFSSCPLFGWSWEIKR